MKNKKKEKNVTQVKLFDFVHVIKAFHQFHEKPIIVHVNHDVTSEIKVAIKISVVFLYPQSSF